MVVSSGDRLSLPDGASATLLFQSGEMLRLTGPFEGTLEQQQAKPGEGGVSVLADMFRMHGGRRDRDRRHPVRPAGRRTASTSMTSKSTRNAPAPIASRRPPRSGSPGRPTHGFTRCAARAAVARWVGPPGRSGQSGRPMSRSRMAASSKSPPDGAARATVTFRAMPADAADGPGGVATGLLLGCHEQFDRELNRISRSTVRPELWMTSDHGRRPTYHPGEPVALTVMADTDGYLYCFAAAADGTTVPIFPAGAVDGAQIRGSVALSIPGGRQPAGLAAASGGGTGPLLARRPRHHPGAAARLAGAADGAGAGSDRRRP